MENISQEISQEERKYWIAYSHLEQFDWEKVKLLVKKYGCLEKSWNQLSSINELNFTPAVKQNMIRVWKDISPDQEEERHCQADIQSATIIDREYPELLKKISDPPPIIFYRGSLPVGDCLASVGSRRPSSYGQGIVNDLIGPVSRRGVNIVSGLAYGIDKQSHQACLSVNGQTTAILGGGLSDQDIYPRMNLNLAREIIEKRGGLISEYPINREIRKHYFVARNRIIAGLSKATLVIEAAEKSGSLITAEFAIDEGRDVLAVPGNIDQPNSQGTNNLIIEGAIPITDSKQILECFNLDLNKENDQKVKLSVDQEKIIKVISQHPASLEEIHQKIKLDVSQLAVILSTMELKRVIKKKANNKFYLS